MCAKNDFYIIFSVTFTFDLLIAKLCTISVSNLTS